MKSYPPRESWLRKAALTLLAAATAAVFVCAPAGAIEITSISPSGSYWDPAEVIEHMNNMVEIRTDVDFKRVEWTFNGKTSIDNGTEDGTDTSSAFIPTLDGLGRPWGVRYAVTATAYDNDDVSVTEDMWFRVWSDSDRIAISEMTGPSNVVVGESFRVRLETDAGYSRVEWYVNNANEPAQIDYGPHYRASFEHSFGEGAGKNDRNGKKHEIEAVVYAVGSSPSDADPVKDDDIFEVYVHGGIGRLLWETTSDITHVNRDEDILTLHCIHNIRYYCEPEDSKPDVNFYWTLTWNKMKTRRRSKPELDSVHDSGVVTFKLKNPFYEMSVYTQTMELSIGMEEEYFYQGGSSFTANDFTQWDAFEDPDKSPYGGDVTESLRFDEWAYGDTWDSD